MLAIHCNLCVRACREVQVNDVIGMAYRGVESKIIFDFDAPMGSSTCVACGECIQACPTGALIEEAFVDKDGIALDSKLENIDSVCPYCGVGCQITYQVQDNEIVAVQGRDGPANHNRLCVKGRFGFDYVKHPHRLTKPLIRLENVPKSADDQVDPGDPYSHFREATWEEALDRAASGFLKVKQTHGPLRIVWIRFCERLERRGVSGAENDSNRILVRTMLTTVLVFAMLLLWLPCWKG